VEFHKEFKSHFLKKLDKFYKNFFSFFSVKVKQVDQHQIILRNYQAYCFDNSDRFSEKKFVWKYNKKIYVTIGKAKN
jgi:hypothetical protein